MSDAVLTLPEPEQRVFAAGVRGFGPAGIIAFLTILAGALVFMPIAAALILLWAWLSKTPWRDIGLARPRSWLGGAAIGIALGVGLKFVLKAVVLPLLGAPPVNASFHHLAGNLSATLDLVAYAIYGAGFAEELVFRGYLFERLGKLLGNSTIATMLIVVVTTALFGAAHWQQGPYGIINAAFTGTALAIVFLACKRMLFVPMVMHAAFDITAAAMIYLNLETEVAHLVFK